MTFDIMKGLLDLYGAKMLGRDAVLAMGDYYIAQQVFTGEDKEGLEEALDLLDAGQIASVGALVERKEALEEENIRVAVAAAGLMDDTQVLAHASMWPEYQVGRHYAQGFVGRFQGALYRVAPPEGVTMQAHQLPGGEGMLAVYRPIVVSAAGTAQDPIPFVYGMDVEEGKYYGHEGLVYLAKAAMQGCVWAPGTEGLWQWERVEG